MKKIMLVGCGGVGSWILPALIRQCRDGNIIIVDGDKLEKKNLDRQLFTEQDIGSYKAQALADHYGCKHENRWFAMGIWNFDPGDWIIVAADNHPARNSALQEADSSGASVLMAMNETWSSEALVYHRHWREGERDPRVYYPEISSSRAGDRHAAAAGCTGDAAEANPQLVNANFMAASLALHLFALWSGAGKLSAEALKVLPYRLVSNMTRFETHPKRSQQ